MRQDDEFTGIRPLRDNPADPSCDVLRERIACRSRQRTAFRRCDRYDARGRAQCGRRLERQHLCTLRVECRRIREISPEYPRTLANHGSSNHRLLEQFEFGKNVRRADRSDGRTVASSDCRAHLDLSRGVAGSSCLVMGADSICGQPRQSRPGSILRCRSAIDPLSMSRRPRPARASPTSPPWLVGAWSGHLTPRPPLCRYFRVFLCL